VALCGHLEWYELSSILAMQGTSCLEMEYLYTITLCHLPETAVFVGEMQVKFLALLILLQDGNCVIGFVTHFSTPDVDLRLLWNQWSGSGGDKHVMIKVRA
jgi:hypothetical protein